MTNAPRFYGRRAPKTLDDFYVAKLYYHLERYGESRIEYWLADNPLNVAADLASNYGRLPSHEPLLTTD